MYNISDYQFTLWGNLVSASAIGTGLSFIITCMIWPDDYPRDEFFVDGSLLLIGGTVIQLLCRIVDLLTISEIREEIKERKEK